MRSRPPVSPSSIAGALPSPPGEGFWGGAWLYVMPVNKRDSACWRPASLAGRRQAGSPLFERTAQCPPPTGDADAGGDRALCGHVRLFRPHPALARHLPHPGEGLGRVQFLKNYLLTKVTFCQKNGAVSKSRGTAAVAFPRVGKVARQRRMRAKSASAPKYGVPPQAFPRVRKVAHRLRLQANVPQHTFVPLFHCRT